MPYPKQYFCISDDYLQIWVKTWNPSYWVAWAAPSGCTKVSGFDARDCGLYSKPIFFPVKICFVWPWPWSFLCFYQAASCQTKPQPWWWQTAHTCISCHPAYFTHIDPFICLFLGFFKVFLHAWFGLLMNIYKGINTERHFYKLLIF